MNKRGFTLVELLAVIMILGILTTMSVTVVSRWIGRSKKDVLSSQKNTLEMAAKAYAQEYPNVLPKAIGQIRTITAQNLRDMNFLKEDLKDADKKSCMENSFVKIYKYDKAEYKYSPYLYCGDEIPENNEVISLPVINPSSILFDMNTLTVSITYKGNIDGTIGLSGYSYTVSAIYTDHEGDSGTPIEVYRSEFFKIEGKKEVQLTNISLQPYVNSSKYTQFMITAEAYNEKGGYSVTSSSKSSVIEPN